MIEKLTGRTKIIEKSLDAAWLRNSVIADNIANVDTPGYKRKVVKFEEFLKDAQNSQSLKNKKITQSNQKTNNNKIAPVVVQDESNLQYRLDGNNVDIENEMASMAKNTIKYNVLIEGLNMRHNFIKHVISEGRRW